MSEMSASDFIYYYKPDGSDPGGYNRILYHYVPLKYGMSDLKKARLKLSRPTDLNDPLDSAGFYKGYPAKEVFFKHFANMLFKEQVSNLREQGVPDVEIWREYRGMVSEAFSRTLVPFHPLKDNLIASFCAETNNLNTDVLLWSHYADNCKGIRIGLKFPGGCPYDVCQIVYAKHMPSLNFAKLTRCEAIPDKFNNMLHDYHGRMICTKHTAWKYEQEYRLITNIDDDKYVVQDDKLFFVKIPVNYVQNVDFGCRAFGNEKMKADELFLRMAKELHDATGLDINLFRKAEMQVGRYGYKYVPFKDICRRFLRRYANKKYRKDYLLRCPSWVRKMSVE